MKYIMSLILMFALGNKLFGSTPENKIIVLISPPRSLSVAFLRMMQARGDFVIFHEPTQSVYNRQHYEDFSKGWFREDSPRTFAEVKNRILEQAQKAPVFVKEMSFALREFLIKDDFIKKQNVYFVFLIRNPHSVVISFYNKFRDKSEDFKYWIGYQAAYELFEEIQMKAFNAPYLMFSEELAEDPQKVIKHFCNYVDIPFKEEALAWQDLGSNFIGVDEWHESKEKELVHHWHGEAIKSTGFGKLAHYEIDKNNQPTFSEIQNIDHCEMCREAFYHNLKYYQLFLEKK